MKLNYRYQRAGIACPSSLYIDQVVILVIWLSLGQTKGGIRQHLGCNF